MTDLELLFLVLGIIYFWECAWWATRGSIGFRTWFGKRWRVAQGSRLLGNQRGGLVFAHPLPPLGTLLSSHCFPLSVSSDAVLAYVPPSIDPARRSHQTAAFFPFDQIQRVEAKGNKVLINRRVFFRAATPTFASQLTATLESLRQTRPAQRARAIEQEIDTSFDTKAIERRWAEFLREAHALRLATNVLFFYLFGVVPTLIWRLGLNFTWPWLLLGTLGCTLAIALHFNRAHKQLYPQAEDERFTHFIIVLLSPASAIRAHDLIARPLLERFHPLAVARVFCTQKSFRVLAQQFLRELRYPALPVCPNPEPLAQATELSYRELAQSALEKFLRRNACQPEELLTPPPRADQICRSFCPRCHVEFTLSEGSCQDCGGVGLIAFPSRPDRPAKAGTPNPSPSSESRL